MYFISCLSSNHFIFFKGGSTDAVHSGLARQVSSLLTNHLARATECCGNQAAGNDALQDVLSLLNDLSRLRLCHVYIYISINFIFYVGVFITFLYIF